MRNIIYQGSKALFMLFISCLFWTGVHSQTSIDWSKDTVSKQEAKDMRLFYEQNAKKAGQKNVTLRVNFQVAKLKAILDQCAAKGINDVSFMITTLRQYDLARYRRNHPGITTNDDDLKGMQVLILRVPRRAFGALGASINLHNNATVVSLLSFGMILLDKPYGKVDDADDVYLTLAHSAHHLQLVIDQRYTRLL